MVQFGTFGVFSKIIEDFYSTYSPEDYKVDLYMVLILQEITDILVEFSDLFAKL
jgi:hypothetical protein